MQESRKREDTTAESEAAEDFSIAELSFRRVVAGKYPRNWPSADVFAFDKERKRVVDVQVKYRHAASAGSVEVGTSTADFVVIIRGNAAPEVGGRKARQVWVIPMSVIRTKWANGKIRIAQIEDRYLGAWDLIVRAVGGEQSGTICSPH